MFSRLFNAVAFTFYKTKWTHHLPRLDATKPKQVPIKQWKIFRGDTVKIRTGKDRGRVGSVIKVYRKSNQVIVKGMNKRPMTKSTIIKIQGWTMAKMSIFKEAIQYMYLMLDFMIKLSKKQ